MNKYLQLVRLKFSFLYNSSINIKCQWKNIQQQKIVQLLCLFDITESVKSPLLIQKLNENWKFSIGILENYSTLFFPCFCIDTGIRNRNNVAPKACRNASITAYMMSLLGVIAVHFGSTMWLSSLSLNALIKRARSS